MLVIINGALNNTEKENRLMLFVRCCILSLVLTLSLLAGSATCANAALKVLVVFSYEQDFPWDVDIREGIEAVFNGEVELHYFYMDTKVNLAAGEQKAAAAFALYQRLQPDGVIAADDNAQSLFVVPYLKNKVTTPVMFCGVNAEPEVYGYPASNVSGILERLHLEETINFSRQFVPKIKTFAFLIKQSPVAKFLRTQLEKDAARLSARLVAFHQVRTSKEALAVAVELRGHADLLIIESLQGVLDGAGQPVSEQLLVSQVVRNFAGPTAGTNAHTVKYGALNAVIKSGHEQGSKAARMLQQALQGVPVTELPITRNYRGSRMLNVTTMKQLGIVPKPISLRGATLLRTE